MKKIYKGTGRFAGIMVLSMLVLVLGSCKKYLDIKKTSSRGIIQTAGDCQEILDNYGEMNAGYPTDGEASADDYYLDETGWNAVGQEDWAIYGWSPSAIRQGAATQWMHPYKTIYYANLVLEGLQKESVMASADQLTRDQLKGAALFFRAFALWNVAQLYTKPYSTATAGSDPGIPIRLTSDVNEVSSRGTVQQTYDRITQDLQEAVNILPATSNPSSRPNKKAAYAMLARVYLSMENYPLALSNASSALVNAQLLDYNDLSQDPYSSHFERFNIEVLFHSVMAVGATLDPNYGSTAMISEEISSAYEENDLRKNVFLADRGDGQFYFVGNYDPAFDAQFFNGLAVDEMLLTRAECYARDNKVAEAWGDLNRLLSTRWQEGTYVERSGGSAEHVLRVVLQERRKELLMRGQRWTDLRRLNKDPEFKKDLSRSILFSNPDKPALHFSLPANDIRYTLLIPQEVINNSDMKQNPR